MASAICIVNCEHHMLQKENRLKKVRDFNLLIKHGYWVSGQFLRIKALELAKIQDFFPKKDDPNNFKKQLRLAITVGLKVCKSAVKRNRIRRQIGEVVRLLIKEGLLKEGYYILIVATKDVLARNFTEIGQEMKLLLRRTKVLDT